MNPDMRTKTTALARREPDWSRPLTRRQHEAFAGFVAAGISQHDAYIKCYPHAKRWKRNSVDSKAARLMVKIRPRVQHLIQVTITDSLIASRVERMRILSEIARADPADYLSAGADGAWFNFGPESKNRRAIQSIKSRTEMSGEGDGKGGAVITELRLRDPVQAIDILNKMDRLYSDARDSEEFEVIFDMGSGPPQRVILGPRKQTQLDATMEQFRTEGAL